MTIITHPDNLNELRKAFRSVHSGVDTPMVLYGGINFQTIAMLPRTRKTGRFVLPGGRVVEREAVRVDERFIEYGPEDIPFLLRRGIIQEETELAFWQAKDA